MLGLGLPTIKIPFRTNVEVYCKLEGFCSALLIFKLYDA